MDELTRKLEVATQRARRPETAGAGRDGAAQAKADGAVAPGGTVSAPSTARGHVGYVRPAGAAVSKRTAAEAKATVEAKAVKAKAAPEAKAAKVKAEAEVPKAEVPKAEVPKAEVPVALELAEPAAASEPAACEAGAASRRVSCAAAAVCMGFACSCGEYDEPEATPAKPTFAPADSLPRGFATSGGLLDSLADEDRAGVDCQDCSGVPSGAGDDDDDDDDDDAADDAPPTPSRSGTAGDWPQQVLRRLSAVVDSVALPGQPPPLSPLRPSQRNSDDRFVAPAKLQTSAPTEAALSAADAEEAEAEAASARLSTDSSVISGLSITNESTLFAHTFESVREAAAREDAIFASLDASLASPPPSTEPSGRTSPGALDVALESLSSSPLVAHLSELAIDGVGGAAAEEARAGLLDATDSMEEMCRAMLESARQQQADAALLFDDGNHDSALEAAAEQPPQPKAVTVLTPTNERLEGAFGPDAAAAPPLTASRSAASRTPLPPWRTTRPPSSGSSSY